jgi:hypothetical protein
MGLIHRIKWIKNVKRNEGSDWAYMEESESENFNLAFSKSHKAGASKPSQGDVIVLFQSISDSNIAKPGTYLTHLVLVDSDKEVPINRVDYPVGRSVIVLARATPGNALKSDEIKLSFEDVNTGQLCRFNLFNKTKSREDNRRRIVDLFNPFFSSWRRSPDL